MGHFVDLLKSKEASNRNMTRTLNAYSGTSTDLLKDLEEKFLQTEGGLPPFRTQEIPTKNWTRKFNFSSSELR